MRWDCSKFMLCSNRLLPVNCGYKKTRHRDAGFFNERVLLVGNFNYHTAIR